MKALEYPKVFKVLLDGGYIVVVAGKTYSVVDGGNMVGHITEKMFRALIENEVIKYRDTVRGHNYEYQYWEL